MRNLGLAIPLLIATGVTAFAQSGTGTRPRVVPGVPTATPPVMQNDPRPTSTPSGPPVLIGGNRPMPSATATPKEDDDIIRVETNLVTMPVSVLDRDGRFI